MSREHPYIGSNDYPTIPHWGNNIPYRDKKSDPIVDELKNLKKQVRKLKKQLREGEK